MANGTLIKNKGNINYNQAAAYFFTAIAILAFMLAIGITTKWYIGVITGIGIFAFISSINCYIDSVAFAISEQIENKARQTPSAS